ncbi:MAG: glycosyltransferase family 39 protein [Planctomycetia bacterium]|nr:glycosyltransferase family 39 protein [Planctomycetia bacterium]
MAERSPSDPPSRHREFRRELYCGGVLAAAFVLQAWVSWRTWPDILVDFGQELYVPWRLSEGDVLYRDIAWVSGPLSQYANSLLFRLFGVSLTMVIAANLTILAVIVALLYYLFRQCGSRRSATFIGLFFLMVFAFRQYSLIGNYNYVCPYRHDITHGLALGLVNLVCLVQFGRNARTSWLAAAGLCLGLLALTKIEMLLSGLLTTAAALSLFAWQNLPVRERGGAAPSESQAARSFVRLSRMARWALIVTASAAAPLIFAVGGLAVSLGWTSAFRQIFLQYRLALLPEMSTSSGFYRSLSGWDAPGANLLSMVLATVLVIGAVVIGCIVDLMIGRSKRITLWAIFLGIAVAYCGLAFVPPHEWQALPACLPLLLAAIIAATFLQAAREPSGDGGASILLVTAVYGLSLLPKILLHVTWNHYGFVLAAPGTLVVIHVGVHAIPAWWYRRRKTGRCVAAIAVGVFTAGAVSLALIGLRIDLTKTIVVGQGGDRFYSAPAFKNDGDGRTAPTVNTLAWLQQNMRPGDSLVVFPNGVMLNYLLRARNPTPFIMFSPWESDVHGGEDRVADAVIRAAPDFAVIVTMDMTIHGRGNFGDPQFGGRIRKFLDEHYDVVDEQISLEGVDGRFVSTVFRRRVNAE